MIKNYLSLVKFSHTVFAMPFALIGFSLGLTRTNFSLFNKRILLSNIDYARIELSASQLITKFILVIACMVFARSAAMAFNRWADAYWDAQNPRTAIREIPKGIISGRSATIFVIINSLMFIVSAWFINLTCFLLSPVALLIVLGYSYTKRFTFLCHIILGIGLALAPIGAYLALANTFSLLPLLFSFAVLFWVSGFDIIYALQDEVFDRDNQLHSIPVLVGKKKALRISELLHILSAISIIVSGALENFGVLYWIGVVFFISMLIYQHSIVSSDNLKRVNLAFMTVNGIASSIFSLFVICDLFFYIHL